MTIRAFLRRVQERMAELEAGDSYMASLAITTYQERIEELESLLEIERAHRQRADSDW